MGLKVTYDLDEMHGDGWLVQTRSWLASKIGKDFVSVPVAVERTSNACWTVRSDDLRTVARLPWLRRIILNREPIDDEGMPALARLRQLKELQLSMTMVSNRGLAALENCDSLRTLVIGGTHVTGEAVAAFAARHPHCTVKCERELTTHEELEISWFSRRADRVLTPDEKEVLDAAVQLLDDNEHDTNMQRKRALDRRIMELSYPSSDPPNDDQLDLSQGNFFDLAFLELHRLAHADAIPVLERFARDQRNEDDWRARAIEALGQIPDPRVIPILLDLLADNDGRVAFSAWSGLNRMMGVPENTELGWDNVSTEFDYMRPAPPQFVARWRQYWLENKDVIRLRRADDVP
jgi:hypothetical protein